MDDTELGTGVPPRKTSDHGTHTSKVPEKAHESVESQQKLTEEEEKKHLRNARDDTAHFAYYKSKGRKRMCHTERLFLSQTEFTKYLMSKRQEMSFWKNVSHFSAVLSDEKQFGIVRLRFVAREYENDPLFEYCRSYVLQLMESFRPELVLADSKVQVESGKLSSTEYCLRMAMKLVCFMEICQGVHVSKACFEFVRFSKHRYYMLDITNIHWRKADLSKVKLTYQEVVNLRSDDYTQQHLKKVMYDNYHEDEEKMRVIQQKQSKMNLMYQEAKEMIGLDLYKKEPIDNRSDEAFAQFHPDLARMKITLSDIIDLNVEMNGIKKYFRDKYGAANATLESMKKRMQAERAAMVEKQQNPGQGKSKQFAINSKTASMTIFRRHKGSLYESPWTDSDSRGARDFLKSAVRSGVTHRDSESTHNVLRRGLTSSLTKLWNDSHVSG